LRNKKYIHIAVLLIIIFVFYRVNLLLLFAIISIYLIVLNYPTILFLMGSNKYSQKQVEKANKYFDRMDRCFYSPASRRISYVYILLLQGDVDKAEGVIKSILKKTLTDKEKLDLNLNYSLVMWKKNDLDKAIDILQKVHVNTKSTVVYQNLGYFLLLRGDYKAALEFNLEALSYNTSNSGIMDNLAENYYYLGEYDKAIEIFDEVISKAPTFATPYYYCALTLIKQDNKEKALEVLRKGLECKFSSLSITNKDVLEAKILELEAIEKL